MEETHPVLQLLQSLGFSPVSRASCADFPTYLSSNQPVLLSGSSCGTDTWTSASSLLSSLGADTPVPVEAAAGAYGVSPLSTLPLSSFLAGQQGYLKDYRLPPQLAAQSYALPACLCDDALNPYLDGTQQPPPFRFLYAGFPGTRTALHHDILLSHSWSCSLSGHKLWLLLSPQASEALLYPQGRYSAMALDTLLPAPAAQLLQGSLPCSSSLPSAPLPQAWLDRLLAWVQAQPAGPPHLAALVQPPGEVLFVPSGWHHEVLNLGPGLTLSLNHNWLSVCSGPALGAAWAFLSGELAEIRARLQDCRGSADFPSLCERALRTDAGLGYTELAELLCRKVGVLAAGAAGRGAAGVGAGSAAAVPPGQEERAACSAESARAGLGHCARILRCISLDAPSAAVQEQCRSSAALAEQALAE